MKHTIKIVFLILLYGLFIQTLCALMPGHQAANDQPWDTPRKLIAEKSSDEIKIIVASTKLGVALLSGSIKELNGHYGALNSEIQRLKKERYSELDDKQIKNAETELKKIDDQIINKQKALGELLHLLGELEYQQEINNPPANA